MADWKNFENSRVMEYVDVPKIRNICPNERLYFRDKNWLYMLYKFDDNTYPDIGKITERFKHIKRPIIESLWGRETLDVLERFLNQNIDERENVVRLVEDLSFFPEVEKMYELTGDVEKVFENYKNILKPTCELYKTCHYLPTLYHALDIRIYKGNPTKIKRSFAVFGNVGFVMGKLTKKQALNIWNEKFADQLHGDEWIKEFVCIPVREHLKRLQDDRFVNKKGETIFIDHYLKIIKKMEK